MFVRVNSHRARQKMFDRIGKQPCYFSWERHCTGGFYKINDEQAPLVLHITGISKVRKSTDLLRCHEW